MTQGDPKGQVQNDLSSGWDISDFVDGSVSEHGWNTSQIPRLVSLSGKHYDKPLIFAGFPRHYQTNTCIIVVPVNPYCIPIISLSWYRHFQPNPSLTIGFLGSVPYSFHQITMKSPWNPGFWWLKPPLNFRGIIFLPPKKTWNSHCIPIKLIWYSHEIPDKHR